MNEKMEKFDIEGAKERVSQIDQTIAELRSRQINRVSAISEENKETNDSGTEAAEDQATLGLIRQEVEELERERSELDAKIQQAQS
jgi:hypothetical protein